MEIVYGPVSSWRLGRSLGIDPICEGGKICSFDCVYCSLGPTTEKSIERKVFVPSREVAQALERAVGEVEAEVVTFSGTGEPTLAQNLGELIEMARAISGLPVAVLTNSSLKTREDVRKDLAKADIVKGKLDVPNEELFRRINRPHEKILFKDVVSGLKKFREEFDGEFQLEVMFVPENKDLSEEIAKIVETVGADEVQINTPLRPSAVSPLSRDELREVQKSFEGMNIHSVFESEKPSLGRVIGEKKLKRLKRGL